MCGTVCTFLRKKRYLFGGGGGRGSILSSFLTKICPIHHALTIGYLFKTKHLYFSFHYFLHFQLPLFSAFNINFGLVFKKKGAAAAYHCVLKQESPL